MMHQKPKRESARCGGALVKHFLLVSKDRACTVWAWTPPPATEFRLESAALKFAKTITTLFARNSE
jgi:hypothetical protein